MQVFQLIINLDSLDATIRLFAPDIDPEEIRPKPVPSRHTAIRGEISGTIRDGTCCATKRRSG